MRTLVLSYIYAFFRFSLGLIVHPYQTMQILVQQQIFLWITGLPTFLLVLSAVFHRFFLNRIGILVELIVKSWVELSCFSYISNALSFFGLWLVCFLIYWQLMLLYLLLRFSLAFSEKKP